jgi:hypothetical protein
MLRWRRDARPAIALCGALAGVACTSGSDHEPRAQAAESDAPTALDEHASEAAHSEGRNDAGGVDGKNVASESPDQTNPVPEHRRAARAMMLYTEPSFGAPFRGKISHGEVFAVHGDIDADDPRCGGDGWARLGTAAFGCLENTSFADTPPEVLPRLPHGRSVPFYYARLKPKRRDGTNPPAPIWRTRASLRDGLPSIGALEPEHVYAFDRRRRTRQGVLLESRSRGVVREADVKRLEPRDFEGRDLLETPVPPGMSLAWTVTWPDSLVLAEAHANASVQARLAYHEPLLLVGSAMERRGTTFYRVVSPELGWVDASDIRRWIPMSAPEDVEPDELWLDIELDQQTLTIMRGNDPQFVTLVSTGTWKDPTPPGLFRIGTKEAYGDMRSRATEDDSYHVEAVPWVQYFHNRYALHGAYWHNRFGLRTSHGCVNLSPKDALRVFASTTPRLPPGWIMIYEHAQDLGTLVRVRKLTTAPPDRRDQPRERRASDYG